MRLARPHEFVVTWIGEWLAGGSLPPEPTEVLGGSGHRPPDDVRSLTEAMVRLAGAPQLHARYRMAVKKLLVNKFTAEIIGGETAELSRPMLDA